MQHQTYIDDKADSNFKTKIIAILLVVAAIAAIGWYVVYGSGMWNPPVQHTADY
ncbi:MAG TPA: hypothetical protein VGP01_06610 [Rhizomicrobium sp.]|jgi:hypothetical protein|nr:hypothetical protein [Rhizomicrobium sp.]